MQTVFYDIAVLDKWRAIKRFTKNMVLFFIVFCSVFILSAAFNIYMFSHTNELVNADAAVILGARVWNNKPSPVFRERINHGIWLYKNGYVNYLIFTGGTGKDTNISEASAARNFAVENSVPAGKIFIEEESNTTFENIFYANKIIKNNNFRDVIMVSDPLHMKRSITMAKDFNLTVYSSPTQTTRYISLKQKLLFLSRELFFYISYKIYRHIYIIALYLFLFELLFLACYYDIFRPYGTYAPLYEILHQGGWRTSKRREEWASLLAHFDRSAVLGAKGGPVGSNRSRSPARKRAPPL